MPDNVAKDFGPACAADSDQGNRLALLLNSHAFQFLCPPQWLPVVAGIVPVQSNGAWNDVSGGRRNAMLVHLAMMLSTANGWALRSDDKAHDSSPLSPHDSAITMGGVDGGRARRQLATGCSRSWSVCARRALPCPFPCANAWSSCSQR